MAVDVDDIIPSKYIENVATSQYSSPDGFKVVIDKFVINNVTGAPVDVWVNIVPPSGSAGGSNEFITQKTLSAQESYICPEIVGRCLKPGGVISAHASASNAVTIGATGRLIDAS